MSVIKKQSEKLDKSGRVVGYMADVYQRNGFFEVRVQPTRNGKRFGGVQPAKKFELEEFATSYAISEINRRLEKL